MATIDLSIVFIYFGLMVAIGWYASRKQTGTEDYYVAGRRQGTLSIACLWLASYIGGASIIGAAGRSYEMGITAIWYVTAIGLGCFLFGLLAAARIKRLSEAHQFVTYPDFIEHHYDQRTRMVATITTAVAFIAFSAGQIAAAATILQVLLDWEFSTGVLLAGAVVVMYTATGGYLAVAWTDWVQFVLLIIGVCLIGLPIAIQSTGGPAELTKALPDEFFQLGAWGWPSICALVVSITLSFFTSGDNYTRCFAARNPATASRGTMLATLFMAPLAVAAVWMGMSASISIPGIDQPDMVLTAFVVEHFPAGLKGLMLVGILAAVMSTADICILTASANLTRDVYQRFLNPAVTSRGMLRLGTFASLAIGLLSMLLAWKMRSVLDILLLAFTLSSAALFLPSIMAIFQRKLHPDAAFWSILLALSTVILWYIGGSLGWGSWFESEPLWPGLVVSVLAVVALTLFRGNPAVAATAGP
jgi:SSS family solute:Na+ symporter